MVTLFPHQQEALKKMSSGTILRGGVGSGKSLTSLMYYKNVARQRTLYIITTAVKRDTLEWNKELAMLGILDDYIVDSWNNITKYADIEHAFFIFDEQRAVKTGTWGKTLIKIAQKNLWVLLSATPADCWLDYAPVFIAKGYYRNITEFKHMHVIPKPYIKYFAVERYVDIPRLKRYEQETLVVMDDARDIQRIEKNVVCGYDKELYLHTLKTRIDPDTQKPIKNKAAFQVIVRKIASGTTKPDALNSLITLHKKVLVFYNFCYELEEIKNLCEREGIVYSCRNGSEHSEIPDAEVWVHAIQYSAGCEGWNCIQTNVTIFYSLNYSYRIMTQAKGRIDRINTPFKKLYYYNLISDAPIDKMILRCLKNKKNFNDRVYLSFD